jgi:hypothetical protein
MTKRQTRAVIETGKPGFPPLDPEHFVPLILKRIAGGESVRSICRDEDMPNRDTVLEWSMSPQYSGQFARARDLQAQSLFDEITDIVDDASNDWMEKHDEESGEVTGYTLNGEAIARSRLRAEMRLKMAAQMALRRYNNRPAEEQVAPPPPLGIDIRRLDPEQRDQLKQLLLLASPPDDAIEGQFKDVT